MDSNQQDLLRRAVGEKLTACLAVVGEKKPRQWNLRYLKLSPDPAPGIWAQPTDEKKSELDVPISSGAEMEVSYTQGHQRWRFRTRILKRDKHFWLTDTVSMEALLLKWPTGLEDGERRAHVRYPIGDDSRVLAQLVRSSQWAPNAEREVRVKLWNLSRGGAGFVTPLNNTLLALPPGEPFNVIITHDGRRFEIPARLVSNRVPSGNTLKFGVQFSAESNTWPSGASDGLNELISAFARREELRNKARQSAAKAS